MKKLSANNTNMLFLLLLAMCFLFVACNNTSTSENSEAEVSTSNTIITITTKSSEIVTSTTADNQTTIDNSEKLATTIVTETQATTKATIKPTTQATLKPTAKATTKTTTKPTTKPTVPPTQAVRTWKYESAMSSELFTLVNNYRVSKGVPALKADSKCESGAKTRAEYNAKNQILSAHELSQIGAGGGLKNPTEIISGWKNSEGHNRSLLRETDVIGGCAIYSDSNGWLYAIFQKDDGGNWS